MLSVKHRVNARLDCRPEGGDKVPANKRAVRDHHHVCMFYVSTQVPRASIFQLKKGARRFIAHPGYEGRALGYSVILISLVGSVDNAPEISK